MDFEGKVNVFPLGHVPEEKMFLDLNPLIKYGIVVYTNFKPK